MSKVITQFENDHASLWYYPEAGIIHHKFHQPTGGETFQAILMTGLRLMESNHAIKWLSDDRNNLMLPPEDSAWSQDYWLPRAIKAGWKYWAMLPPDNARGRINIERLVKFVADQKIVTLKLFSDPDEALKWLYQQEPSEQRE
jgi:hypothetical protein